MTPHRIEGTSPAKLPQLRPVPAPELRRGKLLPLDRHPHARFRATSWFGSLDGLRAFAILAVIWHHTAGHGYPGTWLARSGPHGVTLFFGISGFLITTLLLRERQKHGTISMRRFYVRRTLRIFPLYYAVLLAYTGLVWALETGQARADFFANLPAFATYTSNWFVPLESGRVIFYFAWSLATEEQFYLAWPWAERYLSPRASLALVVALTVGLVTIRALDLTSTIFTGAPFLGILATSVAPAICFGVIVAHLLHERSTFGLLWRVVGQRAASPVLLAILIGLFVVQAHPLWIHAVAALLVTSCVIREDNALAPFLRLRLLTQIGTVSYGMYLLHMLGYNAVQRGLDAVGVHQPLVTFVATVALALGLAILSFHTFEAAFLRLGKRFSRA